MSEHDSTREADPNPTVVRLDPTDRHIEPGEETTVDAIVQRIDDGGVGVYDLAVSVDGPATIQSATVGGEPVESLSTTDVSENGTEVTANAISATIDGPARESILTITVQGDDDGDGFASFSVDVRTLGTQAGDTYDVQKEIDAQVRVRDRGGRGGKP